MRLLYSARYARFDLLRAIARLASFIHFWNKECDERLIKLMKYVGSTLDHRQIGWVGDKLESVAPHTYADADFAGCP